jgi:hypothetical protein
MGFEWGPDNHAPNKNLAPLGVGEGGARGSLDNKPAMRRTATGVITVLYSAGKGIQSKY